MAGGLAFGLTSPNALALDGALDAKFDADGKLTVAGGSFADIAAFDDGRMVAVGEFQGGAEMAVFKRDGSLDPSFSEDGLLTIDSFTPVEVAVDSAGAIVWAAQPSTGAQPQQVTLKIGRLLDTGQPDISFNGDGLNDNILGNPALDDLTTDSDRSVVAVGSYGTNNDFMVTRLNVDGNPDTDFGGGDGRVTINASTLGPGESNLESAEAVATEPHPETLAHDDKVVIAGGVDVSGEARLPAQALEGAFMVMKLDGSGNLDTTFASGTGKSYPNVVTGGSDCELAPTRCSQEVESAKAVAIEPDGQIAVAGFTDTNTAVDTDGDSDTEQQEIDFAVAHLNANGTSDTGFSGDGRATTAIAPNNTDAIFDADTAIGIMPAAGNTLVVAGTAMKETGTNTFDGDFAFARYLSNGNLDPAFDHDGATLGNGKFMVPVGTPATESEVAVSAALLSNGNVALAGNNLSPEYGALAVIRNDGTPPNTQIDSGPTQGSTIFTNTPSFTFSAPGEPAITTFECKYDAEPFVDCGSPYVKALSDGAHTFSVRARDAAGNVDSSAAGRSFTVDATPPDTNLIANPGALTADTTPGFSFTSTPGGATFQCAVVPGHGLAEIGNENFASCVSGHSPAVSEGEHTFAVRAIDGGGTDETPATFEFEVDTDAPNGVIVSAPDGPTNDNTPTFAVSTDEPLDIPEGEFAMTCALSGPINPSVACSDAPHTFAQTLPDGAYTFTLTVTDTLARSDATPATAAFTVDTAPPETNLTKKPKKRSTKRKAKFEFESDDPQASFECSLDGKSPDACDSPFTTPKLKPGKHKFEVVAIDAAGNEDPTAAKYSFTVKP